MASSESNTIPVCKGLLNENFEMDLQVAECYLKKVNRGISFVATEWITHAVFQELRDKIIDGNEDSIKEGLAFLNSEWRTRAPAADLQKIPPCLRQRKGVLRNVLVVNAEEDVVGLDKDMLTELLRCFAPQSKLHFSLASKFLHWASGGRLPIVDSNAYRSIRACQKSIGIKIRKHNKDIFIAADYPTPSDKVSDASDEYMRWICWYKRVIDALGNSKGELLRIDKETVRKMHSDAFVRDNTILRVLDKVFYQMGYDIHAHKDSRGSLIRTRQ